MALAQIIEVVRRCDRIDLAPVRRTDEGYLIVEGFIARPGVYEYHVDGKVIRELVLPEDLHDPDSLDTLMRKPMTLGHPRRDVSPENVKQHRVGSIGEKWEVMPDGRVKISFTVERNDAIKAVEAGTHQLSPGYRLSIEKTSGVHPDYGPYDAIQRGRRYNHGAIVDRARGGPQIHLRADEAYSLDRPIRIGDKMTRMLALMLAAGLSREDAAPIADQCEAEAQSRVDEAVEPFKTQVATLEGERDAQKSRADAAEADKVDPLDARLDWYNERATLIPLAEAHGIEDVAKLDNDDVARKIVRKLDADCAEDASPEYVKAYLKVHKDSVANRKPGASMYNGKPRKDSEDLKDPNVPNKDAVDAHFDAIEEERRKRLALPTGD